MSRQPVRHEQYVVNEVYIQELTAQRPAYLTAGFLLPHLHPGQRLLDVGCGPRSITVDLAAIVAPGEVVGIDLREADLDRARTLADQRQLANVRFEMGSAYELPFPEASFDVVFASRVLMHLGDRMAAVREMRRVLRPGGLVGISDPMWSHQFRFPPQPALEAWDALVAHSIAHRGGDANYASGQRALLRAAGFERTVGYGTVGGDGKGSPAGTLEATRQVSQVELVQLKGDIALEALAQGWATQADLDAMAEALTAWGDDPDAYRLIPFCCTIGWR